MEITKEELSKMMSRLANARWAKKTKKQRKAYSKMMSNARYGKKDGKSG